MMTMMILWKWIILLSLLEENSKILMIILMALKNRKIKNLKRSMASGNCSRNHIKVKIITMSHHIELMLKNVKNHTKILLFMKIQVQFQIPMIKLMVNSKVNKISYLKCQQ